MSDQSSPSSSPSPAPRRGRGWLFITTIAVLAALTGVAASQAVGHGPGYWRHHAFMGPLDPAQAEERADRFMRHVAIELDATPEQQDKLRTIAKGAVKDLLPMRDKAQAARERARGLLTQPIIDRGSIESFRAEQMALAETASKRIAQALGDAAEVLTPAQRSEVQQYLEWRRSHWRPWRRS
jgi:Spy/CpxP family protein refolding chaperone